MNLERKGMLVVGLPLLLQLCIVIGLACVIWQTQKLTAQSARSTELVSSLNQASNLFSRIMDQCGGMMEGNNKRMPEALAALYSLSSKMDTIVQKLAIVPGEAENANKLALLKERFVRDGKQLFDTVTSSDPLIPQSRDVQSYKLFFDTSRVYDLTNKILAKENERLDSDSTNADSRSWIRVVMIIAVIASTIAAMTLAIFTSKAISKPLVLLTENAHRLAKRETLHASLKGSDELVQLDHTIHKVDRAIEEALAAERNLILHAADMVLSLDGDFIVTNANPAVTEKLGKVESEITGVSVLSLLRDEEREGFKNMLKQCQASGASEKFELSLVTAGGAKEIETSWSITWSAPDQSFFCVAHDITEQKEVERLKQQFISMISDDLKNPLSSVLQSLASLKAGQFGVVSDQMTAELTNVDRSLTHLVELLTELLDFDSLQSGKMTFDLVPVSTVALVDESLHLVRALADSKKVTIAKPNTEHTINVDKRKIIEVLVNLLSNALKHSPESAAIEIHLKNSHDYLEVSVHDDGPGVPDEHKQRIFAPFEQITERSTAALGTGLGLAICKLIVEGHGGAIGVRDSDVLSGSAFWFTIPAS
ncbi:MAG TPA: ATP-binding protein [Drouetiella sp.]